MATISAYLTQLKKDKETLYNILYEKEVEVYENETFTSLIPKIDEIKSYAIEDCKELFAKGNYTQEFVQKIVKSCFPKGDASKMFGYTTITSLDLSMMDMSKVTNASGLFYYGYQLNEVIMPTKDMSVVTDVSEMFRSASRLNKIDLSCINSENIIESNAMFMNCSNLIEVVIDRQNIFPMTSSNMFGITPISSGTGYVYVPDNMVELYKSATNWSIYANQIKSLSELEGYNG